MFLWWLDISVSLLYDFPAKWMIAFRNVSSENNLSRNSTNCWWISEAKSLLNQTQIMTFLQPFLKSTQKCAGFMSAQTKKSCVGTVETGKLQLKQRSHPCVHTRGNYRWFESFAQSSVVAVKTVSLTIAFWCHHSRNRYWNLINGLKATTKGMLVRVNLSWMLAIKCKLILNMK